MSTNLRENDFAFVKQMRTLDVLVASPGVESVLDYAAEMTENRTQLPFGHNS